MKKRKSPTESAPSPPSDLRQARPGLHQPAQGPQKPPSRPRPVPPRLHPWHYVAGLCAALFAAFLVYGHALSGPFVFDDVYLPFNSPGAAAVPLYQFVSGVRPLLMFTFWANLHVSGLEPFSYHLVNVLFHVVTASLVFLIVRRFLSNLGTGSDLLSAFAAALFLLHPVETESVAYVASRSETLSVMLAYAAFTVFLYRRRQAVSWSVSAAVLVLFAAAASTKEHTVVLPVLLLLTDWFFNPGFSFQGIRRNWRLYLPMAAGALISLRFVWNVLRQADSAGFQLKSVAWYQYFFTQCRAVWVYIRLFFLPYGQNIDYDMPVSHTLLEHGAIVGFIGLAALATLAFLYRRRYPLASYGLFAFLILLAPTSSFVPIADAIAERRLYLPTIGLLLVIVEFLRRWRGSRRALAGWLAAALFIAAWLTYQRNQVWASDLALWQDSIEKAPHNSRAHFQLAFAHYAAGRCNEALDQYNQVARLTEPDYRLLLDWGLAYVCAGKPEEALSKFRQAAALSRTGHVYSLIGMVYAKQNKRSEALQALNTAVALDASFEASYLYRGNVYAAGGDYESALQDYRRALTLNPGNNAVRQAITIVESRRKAGR